MDLNELLVDPTGVQTWRLGESELLISTTELSQRICELEGLRLRMVTDLDTRGTAKTLGASNTAAWLSGATRMSPGAATGMVHLGRALTELADTAEALAAGRISTAHAKVVTGFFAHLPDGGEGPVEGAERPHLSLLIRAEDLAAGGESHGGSGWMPWLGPISAAGARRIACDCELTVHRRR